MKTKSVKPVVLSATLGRKWWQVPNGLWLRSERIRERRLRLILRRQILPMLQEVERLQHKDYPNAPLFLQDKRLGDIERDPVALEVALYMYQVAMSKGLICHKPAKDAPAASIHRGGALKAPMGSCGISPNDVVKKYVQVIAITILEKAGHDPKYLSEFLSASMQTQIHSLNHLRILCKLNKDIISEMRKALGKLDPLLEKDEQWLNTLSKADAKQFILPLKKVLKVEFPIMLEWSQKLLDAFIEHLQSAAQIYALGPSIESINNPGIVESLGSWPMENDENGKVVSRIQNVKLMLGDEVFDKFIQGSPALVKDLGSWPQQKIEAYKPYLGFMTGPALESLNKLDDSLKLAVMAGLVDRFDAFTIRKALKTKEGLKLLKGIVSEILTLNHNTPQTPAKVRKLISGSYLDSLFETYMPKDEF